MDPGNGTWPGRHGFRTGVYEYRRPAMAAVPDWDENAGTLA